MTTSSPTSCRAPSRSGELLLANDTDANGDPLTATPTTFNTGWAAKGADFIGTGAVSFAGNGNTAANQSLADVRASFAANTAAMTAMLVISGYLGAVTMANANDEDLIIVKLKQGETFNLDHNLAAGHITTEYSLNGGAFVTIADGGTITATADGTYQTHLTYITNTGGSNTTAAENYQLTMTVNYAGAHDVTQDFHGTYTANDNHGGSDVANVSISYQDGHTLTGTSGDDVLVTGPGNNTLTGGPGADTFQWLAGNSGRDVATDFTPGTDKLDLSQLLQGENGTAASLDDYLHSPSPAAAPAWSPASTSAPRPSTWPASTWPANTA